MRILLTTPFVGGAGGIERYGHSAVAALEAAGHSVVLVFGKDFGGRLSKFPASVKMAQVDRIATPWTSRRALRWTKQLTPLKPVWDELNEGFDIHLALSRRPIIGGLTQASIALLNPCGSAAVPLTHGRVNLVAMEAPSNAELLTEDVARVLLAPPVGDLDAGEAPPPNIPSEFLLTVFNPNGPVKGMGDLETVARRLPLPLVWCHSSATIEFTIPQNLRENPRIIHVDGPTSGQLRWLYERAAAYISFSRREGFGWATADALRYTNRVHSRHTGVISFDEARRSEGVFVFDSTDELLDNLLAPSNCSTKRSVSWCSPEAFCSALEGIHGARRG